MPVQVQYRKKGSNDPWSTDFIKMDLEICLALDEPCHETAWHANWYNTVLFGIALTNPFEKLKELFPEKLKIIEFLEKEYEFDSYRTFGGTK